MNCWFSFFLPHSHSVPARVTRFGEISPLWINFISICLYFQGCLVFWQHFEHTLAIFMTSIGQIFIIVKAKYWKMILQSGHTGSSSHLFFHVPCKLRDFPHKKRALIWTKRVRSRQSLTVLFLMTLFGLTEFLRKTTLLENFLHWQCQKFTTSSAFFALDHW